MTDSDSLDAAFDAMDQAVNKLAGAVETRVQREQTHSSPDIQLQRMIEDRNELADKLDLAAAKTAHLEEANREVSKRLVAAMESIRSVLEPDEKSG